MAASEKGFTLVEVLVSLSIISILTIGIFNLVQVSLQLTNSNKNYAEATAIANEKMEIIRNLDYANVGTVSGSPVGLVADYEIVDGKTTPFTVHTTIIFYDDSYDGSLGTGDTVFTDYKRATVDVSWKSSKGTKNVTVYSNVIPLTEETPSGYGLLKVQVVDSNGAPVSNANIHLQKNTAPIVNVDYVSDLNGYKSIPLLPAVAAYNVTITKTGYNNDQTYAATTSNPNPYKLPYTVINNAKTEDSFKIDYLATLRIKTISDDPLSNILISPASSTYDNRHIAMGGDSNNNIYYVWQAGTTSYEYIYEQKFNSSGVKQWPDNKLIASSSNFQNNPDMAVAKNGDTFVVWDDDSVTMKSLTMTESERKFAREQNDKKNLQSIAQGNGQEYTKLS